MYYLKFTFLRDIILSLELTPLICLRIYLKSVKCRKRIRISYLTQVSLARAISLFLFHALTQTYKSPVLPARAHITTYSAVLRHKIYFTVPTLLLPRRASCVVNQKHFSSGPQSRKRDGGARWGALF